MNISGIKTLLTDWLYIIWAVLIILIFMLYSGTVSHLYGSTLENWHEFPDKFLQIDWAAYTKDLIIAFAEAVCFALTCTSLGSIFFPKTPSENIPPWEWVGKISTAFLFGEIAFSFALMGLGILGKLSPINTSVTLLAGGGAGITSFKKLLGEYPKTWRDGGPTKYQKLVLWLSMAILASTMFFTSARISYDSTAFYFSDAKITAITNRIAFFPNDSFVVSSFHTGVLYTAVIQIAGDQAARFVSWISGIFIILTCMALAEQIGISYKGKLTTLILLVTTTALLDPFGDGKIELATSLPALTAIYWLVKAHKTKDRNAYLFAGIFAGFAIISRPYNLFLLGGFIGIYFLTSDDPYKSLVKPYIIMALAFVFMLSVHLLANWAILDEPLAPINNTPKVTAAIWQWSGFNPENIWVARIFYPFVATFLNTPQSMGNITPLILICLPMLFHKEATRKMNITGEAKRITLISLVILSIWIAIYFTIFEIRYVFFLWIIIYMAVAEIINAGLETLPAMSRNVYMSAMILLLFYVLARNIFIAVDARTTIDKNGNPQCNDSMFCDYLLSINQVATPGDRVLGLSAFRYYLRGDLFACSSRADEYLELRDALRDSSERFWLEVYRQGYAYIAYEENYSLRHLNIDFPSALENPPGWVRLRKLSETHKGYFSTYQIEFINAPAQKEKTCINDNDQWLVEEIP